MSVIKTTVLSSGIALAGLAAYAQGTFQNLDFEMAMPSTPINGPLGPLYQPVSLALPGWTAYIGTAQQSLVLQNDYTGGLAGIDLFGPNYPAAGDLPSLTPGTIAGNYSVLVESGGDPGVGGTTGASIAQTGTIPPGTGFVEFKAWQTPFTQFTVSFAGNSLSPVVLGGGANYILYGVNVSPYDGESGPLEFTADFSGTGASWLGLDDIALVPVPEPNILALLLMGGVALAVRCWRTSGR